MAKTKSAKRAPSKKSAAKGRRYTRTEKRQIIEYVEEVNAEKGRGGLSAAAVKFGVSPLSISNWIKSAGGTLAMTGPGSRAVSGVLGQLVSLREEIEHLEKQLATKRAQFDKLKRKL